MLLKKILNKFSKKNDVRSSLMKASDDYRMYDIGEGTYGKPRILTWGEDATLKIGKYCSIAEGVIILLGGEHYSKWVTTYPFSALLEEARNLRGYPHTKGDVTIGNDVWIGRDALILSGVVIGNGSVIGARSVVAKNVAAYSIAAGNPARHIDWRFDESAIESMQKIAWWDWPQSRLVEALPLLMSDRIEEFINLHRKE